MVEFIRAQADTREAGYNTKPILSVDEALKLNFEKGIVAGLRLAIMLPEKMCELEQEAFTQKLHEERLDGNV